MRVPLFGRRPRHRDPRPPAPFVVGVGRSGTTLLRLMLDSHPQLAIPPETHFAPALIRAARKGITADGVAELLARERRWADFGIDPAEIRERLRAHERVNGRRALRAFYETYAEHEGKPRWGDKTPRYARHIALLAATLPEARFVHLVRDGRDTALSRAERAGKVVTPRRSAERWRRWIMAAREQGRPTGRYLELRYEDLVADPERCLRRICEFIELEWDPAMLRHHERAPDRLEELDRALPPDERRSRTEGTDRMRIHSRVREPASTARVERWRGEMSAAEVAEFEAVAGDLLAELGYPLARA